MKIIMMLCALLLSVSCTLKDSKPSRITIDLSQALQSKSVSSSSVDSIEILILNVTGPGMEPVFVQAECHETSCTSIAAEVPAGDNRLIQLLVVGSDSSVTKLLYGDAPVNLNSGNVQVNLSVIEKGAFNNESKWSGRYIPKAGHLLHNKYLTGKVDMKYYPGDNKPDMKIGGFEIFGGWFHSFLLDGVQFKYVFHGFDESGSTYQNLPIFNDLHSSGGMDSSNPNIAAGSSIIHIDSSSVYRKDRNGNFTSTETVGSNIVGFFGENPDSRSLCSKHLNPTTSFLFNGSNNTSGSVDVQLPELCTSASGDATCGTYASWTNHVTVSGIYPHCSSPTSNQFPVDHRSLADEEEFAGFFGPFNRDISVAANQDETFYDITISPKVIGWHIAPNSYIGGIEVFSRVDQGSFDEEDVELDEDLIDCSLLVAHGFVSRSIVAQGTDAYSFLAEETNATDVQFAFCPLNPLGGYFGSAVLTDNREGSSAPQMVSIEIRDNTDTVFSGYSFTDAFDSFETDPAREDTDIFMFYVGFRNLLNQDVDVENIHLHYAGAFASPLSIDHTVAPSGQTACNASTIILNPAGNAGDTCFVRVSFAPAASAQVGSAVTPRTFHDGLSVDTALNSDPTVSSGSFFNLIAPVPYQIDWTVPSVPTNTILMADTDSGQIDVKYFYLNNDDGSNQTYTLNGAFPSNVTLIDQGCLGAPLTPGNGCYIGIEYSSSDSATSANQNLSISASSIVTTTVFNKIGSDFLPSWDQALPYDLGNIISASGSFPATVTNNSALAMNLVTVGGLAGDFTLPTSGCNAQGISVGPSPATCPLTLDYSVGSPYSDDFFNDFWFYYGIGDSYRAYDLSITGSFNVP